ncbi:DNA-binding FadR family transcriptional regulator [Cytobacillus purgationiresistens]|uniref:DNA-binding FadR family transcriptional regulator n=1 Tax=Cytobacillus purgationiresistens TaxID=863449 RepID=A0ABU0ALQ0_9BACI|nr:DNA-binding FadR family transcriptional regulator [Cytobacillus purgationiresistens]
MRQIVESGTVELAAMPRNEGDIIKMGGSART